VPLYQPIPMHVFFPDHPLAYYSFLLFYFIESFPLLFISFFFLFQFHFLLSLSMLTLFTIFFSQFFTFFLIIAIFKALPLQLFHFYVDFKILLFYYDYPFSALSPSAVSKELFLILIILFVIFLHSIRL